MNCVKCGKKLKEGEKVVQVARVVENDNRGDFVRVTNQYIHLNHLTGR